MVSDSLQTLGLQAVRLLRLWDSPSKNTGVGCHFLLQGIVLTQGLNLSLPYLLHWQADSLPLSHQGSPRWQSGKEHTCQCRRPKRLGFDPWIRKILWHRRWQSAPIFLPGAFHRQRSLTYYHLWGHGELDTAERLSLSPGKPGGRIIPIFPGKGW